MLIAAAGPAAESAENSPARIAVELVSGLFLGLAGGDHRADPPAAAGGRAGGSTEPFS
ncbi:hypothetical protein FRAHR75_330044 [Frankia sp. Hr75.2]|nr:hypothetical protein FRAHR75_330044 [Frankia sp. Hr75.2]